MIDIDVDDIQESQRSKLVSLLRTKGHLIEDYNNEDELLEVHLNDCEIIGWDWEPYCPASGSSYSSGGETSSGGYYHLVIIVLYDLEITEMIKESKLDRLNQELSEKKRND